MKKITAAQSMDDTQRTIQTILHNHGFKNVRVNQGLDDANRYYAMVTRHNKIEAYVQTGEVNVYFIDADDQKFDVPYLENLIDAASDIKESIS